jgi:hypothetical protein
MAGTKPGHDEIGLFSGGWKEKAENTSCNSGAKIFPLVVAPTKSIIVAGTPKRGRLAMRG